MNIQYQSKYYSNLYLLDDILDGNENQRISEYKYK